jgi:hypothetical protein
MKETVLSTLKRIREFYKIELASGKNMVPDENLRKDLEELDKKIAALEKEENCGKKL